MPGWFQGMTNEDVERNLQEHRRSLKSEAFNLRQRARALLAEADRIDPPEPTPSTANDWLGGIGER